MLCQLLCKDTCLPAPDPCRHPSCCGQGSVEFFDFKSDFVSFPIMSFISGARLIVTASGAVIDEKKFAPDELQESLAAGKVKVEEEPAQEPAEDQPKKKRKLSKGQKRHEQGELWASSRLSLVWIVRWNQRMVKFKLIQNAFSMTLRAFSLHCRVHECNGTVWFPLFSFWTQ